MLFEFTTDGTFWPSYGMLNFDASSTDSLELRLHTGLTPNPGSGSYNSAYEKNVTLLGPGAPRAMVYGKWLDFYMHVVWHSRTSGPAPDRPRNRHKTARAARAVRRAQRNASRQTAYGPWRAWRITAQSDPVM